MSFRFDNKNTTLIENVEIIANEATKATVILKYESQEDIECFHNGIIKIHAKQDANINIIIAN